MEFNVSLHRIPPAVGYSLLAGLFIMLLPLYSNGQVLSNTIYKPVNEAQELLAQENYSAAESQLRSLLARGDRLKEFDRAKILQLLAIACVNQEKYPEAIDATQQALALQVLEAASIQQMRYTLFNLLTVQQEYRQALEEIELWFAAEPEPGVDTYFSAARVYALDNQWQKALDRALTGKQMLDGNRALTPRTDWYELLVAIHSRLEEFSDTATLLREMIGLWPDKPDYYIQLSGLYLQLNREKNAFTILSLAYENQLLKSDDDIERLARMYRYFNYPYKGALLLSKQFQSSPEKPDEENWSTLSAAWMQAREWGKAESALQQAAELSDDGAHWLKLCQLASQDERWQQAINRCNHSLQQEETGKQGAQARELLALARYRSGDIHGAQREFQRCAEIKDAGTTCGSWQQHIAETLAYEESRSRHEQQQLELARERREQLQEQLDHALDIAN